MIISAFIFALVWEELLNKIVWDLSLFTADAARLCLNSIVDRSRNKNALLDSHCGIIIEISLLHTQSLPLWSYSSTNPFQSLQFLSFPYPQSLPLTIYFLAPHPHLFPSSFLSASFSSLLSSPSLSLPLLLALKFLFLSFFLSISLFCWSVLPCQFRLKSNQR